jgi:hypothetical protein
MNLPGGIRANFVPMEFVIVFGGILMLGPATFVQPGTTIPRPASKPDSKPRCNHACRDMDSPP